VGQEESIPWVLFRREGFVLLSKKEDVVPNPIESRLGMHNSGSTLNSRLGASFSLEKTAD
jgi:hypothetical protein